MIIEVVRPSELSRPEVARWQRLQRSDPNLMNPFLAPQFAIGVGSLRQQARVAVLSDGEEVVGFFAFECRHLGRGVPLAEGLTDCHGLVHAPGLTWSPRQLLAACSLSTWEFTRLVDGQQSFEPFRAARWAAPAIDLREGFSSYVEQLNAKSSSFVRDLSKKRRKLAREHGDLRFVFDDRDQSSLSRLMEWKSAQYRRTGRSDRFGNAWVVHLVREMIDTRSDGFAGQLAMLYAGDRPVAGHVLLRFDDQLAGWFPAYDTQFARYSPGLLARLLTAEHAAAAGIRQITMGPGAKEYKERFKTHDLFVDEGRVVRPSPAAILQSARTPLNKLRRGVLESPTAYRAADRVLKNYGRVRALVGNGSRKARRPVTNGTS